MELLIELHAWAETHRADELDREIWSFLRVTPIGTRFRCRSERAALSLCFEGLARYTMPLFFPGR